ncbi:CapA family protein [Actinotalea sp.]|uniref:CapA family protein n=1 Tax=Actinotalea sp. TaxID=1872145 RepID=UPI002CDC767C|nr:CapA family protein [Actinotalea sp.]HQY33905.1 CapA family protein [Actinotalea sp.]HRA51203.1 CapA family protein [Actinotalea sp.]
MTRHARPRPAPSRGARAARAAVGALVLVVAATGGALAIGLGDSVLGSDGAREDTALGTPSATPSDPAVAPTPTPTPTPTPAPDAVFTLVAAGDVLLHQPVFEAARTADGYDFTPQLTAIQPWVAGADLALCHLEVPVAPAGTNPSGYPMFGSPQQIAGALSATGWDGCSTASNHSLDRGAAGVTTTLDALDAADLGHVGTARSAEEAAAPEVYRLERAGQSIQVAHLAATYGTNGLPIPSGAPWTVNLIDTATLVAQATAARAAGADVVVVSIHCCVEYVSDPTDQQVQVAAELAASGVVDLVIGHHAHVPQPVVELPGGPRGEGMWVAYGLGNFISNQGAHCCVASSDSGLLMLATFTKPADGPVSVTGMAWTAVTVDRGGGYVVEPLSALVAAGQGAGSMSAGELVTRRDRVTAVVGAAPPELTAPPTATGPAPLLRPLTLP